MRKTVLMLALALPAFAAQAQGSYYQSTMPDGRIVIGDKPAPGAKEVKKIPLREGNIAAPVATPGQPLGQAAADRQEALSAADADVKVAQQELQAAQATLEAGREPQPGERIGMAGRGSRLTDAYSQRLKKLEDSVTAAQKRLDDALARRNAAR